MFAVIETGGKQYRVEEGDVLDVERFETADEKTPEKNKVQFDRVLMVGGDEGVKIGSPLVAGAKVTGVLVDEVRGPKIVVFKMKRRKGYKRRTGHRQDLLRVQIDSIEG